MNRERNYRKNPHTARWLQTFHAAASRAGIAGEADLDEERSATEFLTGGSERRTALNAQNAEIFIKGWRILTGPGLITEKQAKWVVDIAETKANVTDAMIRSLAERLAQGFARQAASEFITRYKNWPVKEQPKAETPAAPAADVDEGRYAIVVDGVTKFYRVTKGKGRWAGRTFVAVQASDDLHNIYGGAARAILAEIAKNPMEAMVRYGHELGVCGKCGRTLTDEASRAAGIGPVCASK